MVNYVHRLNHLLTYKSFKIRLFKRLFNIDMSSSPIVFESKDGKGKHTATLIFLHGLGDTGRAWAVHLSLIKPSYMKCICPNAPSIPVTLHGQFRMPAWFDIYNLDSNAQEDGDGIKQASEYVISLIKEEETKYGIKPNRIILGGFSQGGALALHTGLRFSQQLAGIIGLSCWLPLSKDYPDAFNTANKDIPILQCHGDVDPILPLAWAKRTSNLVKTLVNNHDFKIYKSLAHTSSDEEMDQVAQFLTKHTPPL